MASAAAALYPQLANYNPTGFAQQNQMGEQQIGMNALQAQRLQQETALQKQQTQGAALQNQLTQQSIDNSRILQQAYANHANEGSDYWNDPDKQAGFEQELIKGGITYPGLIGYRDQQLKWRQGIQSFNEGQMKLEDTLNQRTTDILQGYKDVPDAQKPQMWAQVTAPALNGLHRGQFDPNNPLVGSALDGVIGAVAHHKALIEEQKEKSGIALQGAQAEEAVARTESEKQKTELTKREIALHDQLINNPGGLERYVAGSIDPQQFPQEYKAAVNEARMTTDIKGLDAVVARHSENVSHQVSQKALETDPQIGAFRLKQQESEAAYNNALQQGDKARGDYYSSYSDLNQTLAAAKTIEKVTELARSNNPVAAQQLKAMVPEFTNAMQDIKRMSGMQGDKGFTSLWDSTINELSSAGGKPLTSATLDQIMPYVRTIANGAVDKHNSVVRSIKGTYGQNHPQEPTPYGNTANPKAPPKQGDKKTYQGRGYIFNGTEWIGQ